MTQFDPEVLVRKIKVDSIRVRRPTSIVFLCGGVMSNDDDEPKMLRDHFYRLDALTAPNYTTILAEKADPLTAEAGYKDLLEFEQDIAQVVSLIILFVESAGSLAELGAFSALPTVAPSLLAVFDEHHYEQNSFVKNGPIKHLENLYGDDSIVSLERPFVGIADDGSCQTLNSENFMEVLKPAIDRRLREYSTFRKFNRSSRGERILLLVGLCQLFGALTLTDIRTFFDIIGVDKDRLGSLIWCAQFLGWIERVRKGNNIYYVGLPKVQAIEFNLDVLQSENDRLRLRSLIREHWKLADKPRSRAIVEAGREKPGS